MNATSIDIAGLIRQIPTQYPFVLVDRVLEHDPAGRLVAIKNVTGSEEFFEGHFPGAPVMPGVLLMEGLAQAAGIWLLQDAPDPGRLEVHLVGIDDAKFRRPAVPGDQLRLEVTVLHRRGALCRVRGEVRAGEHRVAEAKLLLQVATLAAARRRSHRARRPRGRVLGAGRARRRLRGDRAAGADRARARSSTPTSWSTATPRSAATTTSTRSARWASRPRT